MKKNPHLAKDIQLTLKALSENAFHPLLKTHKLKGELIGSWSCSADYDLRIIFDFIEHNNNEAILLASIGKHNEVY